MAVCNIFNKLTKKTGTFLTFSQYMEDLTEWKTESKYHKIIPSKFVAINVPELKLKDSGTDVLLDDESFPKHLQNAFENGCAVWKKQLGTEWKHEYFKTLFWNSFWKIIGVKPGDTSNIKYVGDINIQSFNTVDGMGYSEIYCHIPNDARSYIYSASAVSTAYAAQLSITRKAEDPLEGFSEEDGEEYKLPSDYTYSIEYQYDFSWDDPKMETKINEKEEESFQINMIVVLYDVWNDDCLVAKSVPMGLYITGLIDDDGKITNPITKFIHNSDIYNSGTSYGLRICSRYVVGSQDSNQPIDVVCNSEQENLSNVLSQLSISQIKMDEIVNRPYITDQQYKDLLSIFGNSKTNVPYIKNINGEDMWFVNGKMLNPSTNPNQDKNNCISYANEELTDIIDRQKLTLYNTIAKYASTTATAEKLSRATNKLLLDRFGGVQKIELSCAAFYEGGRLDMAELTDNELMTLKLWSNEVEPNTMAINSHTIEDNTATYTSVLSIRDEEYNYKFGVEYLDSVSTKDIIISYVYPTIFGYSTINYTQELGNKNWINEGINAKNLQKIILGHKEQSHIIDNPSDKTYYIYLIYPKAFGELSSICDEEGYEYFSDFTRHEIQLSKSGDIFTYEDCGAGKQGSCTHYLYVNNKGKTTINNKIISFK